MSERIVSVGGNKATRPITDFMMNTMGIGDKYYVDPVFGDDTRHSGRSPKTAVKTLAEGESRLTANQNDILYVLGGASSLTLTELLEWDKSYTHLIGLAAPGYNCRARIGNSGDEIASLLKISASGCIFKNFRIGNYGSDAAALGTAEVTGSRNYFEGVHMLGPGHATPAGEVGSDALKLTGAEENLFVDCVIGSDAIKRTAANQIMNISGATLRNEFRRCKFMSYAEDAAYTLVKWAGGQDRWTLFDECLFYNFWANHGGTLTEAFDVTITTTHDIIMQGINSLIGIDEFDAGDVAGTWVTGPATAAAGGIGVVPTT
jgi:hypothetical protein